MLPQWKQSTSSCEIKLRELEIDSYSKILSVFRARGNLSNDRRKLLKQIGSFLNISQERHRAEVRRVTNDDLLSTIASRLTGQDWTIDWHEEGKRFVPTPTPFSHLTVNTPLADYIASVASLGSKYVDLYNKKSCDQVPTQKTNVESYATNSEKSSNAFLEDINKVFTSIQKEKMKDVSIQTIKKKIIPKACTYCQRRKELRKKKLESKEKAEAQKKSVDSSVRVEANLETSDDSILLPSGKQIVVENTYSSNHLDDFCVSIIAQEVVVETEPIPGPSFSQQEVEERLGIGTADLSTVPLTTPDFTGLSYDSNKLELQEDNLDPAVLQQMLMNVWDETEKPIPLRLPRILNYGHRKKSKKHSSHHPMKHSSTGERIVRKKSIDSIRELSSSSEPACSISSHPPPVRFHKPPVQMQPSSSRQSHGKHLSSSGVRLNESIPRFPEGGPAHQDSYSKTQVSWPLEGSSKHHTSILRHQDVISKHNEIASKHYDLVQKHNDNATIYNETISKQSESNPSYHQDTLRPQSDTCSKTRDNTSNKPSSGIFKHYVRVRHTSKSQKSNQDVPRQHHTDHLSTSALQYGEMVQMPIEYLQSQRPDLFESPMEVVEINDYKMETAHSVADIQQDRGALTICSMDDHPTDQNFTTNFISTDSSDAMVEPILIPASHDFSGNNNEGRHVSKREEYPSRKVIKIFNGEKKVHGTIHFRSDRMKEIITKLPSTQISQMEGNNGIQPEENANIIWDGTSLSSGEFIMEDVSIADESSYPTVNGHEEIILEEQDLAGSQIIETLVDKPEVCVIPQTDMKFSVVDLSDYTGPIDNLHSVSSQPKDDSRDSDILMNNRS